jgi:hypothetical protein
LRTANLNGTFADYNPALEHTDLINIVIAKAVCFDIHGLAAVGTFGLHTAHNPEREKEKEYGCSGDFHKGTKLAQLMLGPLYRASSGFRAKPACCRQIDQPSRLIL